MEVPAEYERTEVIGQSELTLRGEHRIGGSVVSGWEWLNRFFFEQSIGCSRKDDTPQ
jgi:hypothetical protein